MSEVNQSAPDEPIAAEEIAGAAMTDLPAEGGDTVAPTVAMPDASAAEASVADGPAEPAANAELAVAPESAPESAAVSEVAVDAAALDAPAPLVAEAQAAEVAEVTEVAEAPEAVEAVAEAAPVAEVAEGVVAEAAPVAKASAPADVASLSSEEVDSDGKRVVRTLAVGQEVMGTVKRVSEFGAFVDIGVGRDGLVHISELSVKRVGKVTDVLNEGQVVPMWIKKLDRERNRISLTMIPPGTKTLRDVNQGDIVTGTVTRILPYGAFIDIGVGRDALLHVREMGERYIAKPEEVVKVGEVLEARIIEVQRRRGRIDLSIKGLRPEPEVEGAPAPQQSESSASYVRTSDARDNRDHRDSRDNRDTRTSEPAPAVAGQPEPVDQFADMEMPSAMELALRKAMDQSGVELKISKKKDKQRAEQKRKQQEDIYERTLKAGK